MADPNPQRLSQSYEEVIHTPPSTSSSLGTPEVLESSLPTESHQLANEPLEEGEEMGAAQIDHPDVKDMGWNDHPDSIPTLVGGMQNEELWTLIRRFNKVNFFCQATISILIHNSNSTTSKLSPNLPSADLTSISQTKKSSPQINSAPILNVFT